MNLDKFDFFLLENTVGIINKKIGVVSYDFKFDNIFHCSRPYEYPKPIKAIARVGAVENYEKLHNQWEENGIYLINNINEHLLASELEYWYPLLEELTPYSKWFDKVPSCEDLLSTFTFPMFIKGSRQTAKHAAKLSVAHDKQDLERILLEYSKNDILHWQKFVCREFIELMPIQMIITDKIPISFEFRTFWFKGKLVGAGHYWSAFTIYNWDAIQEKQALNLAAKAVDRLKVPFLVIDLALTKENKWIIIECNDGQESGYAGVNPIALWNNIIAHWNL